MKEIYKNVIIIEESNYYQTPLWERVTNRRLTECTSIHESQLVFTPGRSTTDANFGLIKTVEKYREGQKDFMFGIHRPRKKRMTICVGRTCGDAQENRRSRKSTQG